MIAEAVRHMLAAGMPHDAIIAAIEDMEASRPTEKTRSTSAIRMARKRARDAAKSDESDVTSVTSVTSDAKSVTSGIPPNDIYSNPPENPLGAKAPCPPLAEKVVEAWNDGPGKNGAVAAKPLNADRRKALDTRRREHGDDAVFEAIRNLGNSAWHCGANDRGWRADIGWLLKSPEHFQKALEMTGRPTAKPLAPPGGQPSFLDHYRSKRAA